MVLVHLPPPVGGVSPQFVTLNKGDNLVRIFDPTKHNQTATGFRSYGPISRFDHQREFPNKIDSERSVIYAAPTFSSCLVEVFGDGGIVTLEKRQVAFITLNKTIKLLDLRGSAAMAAGTVAAISAITQRNISQAWGKYFYQTPQLYTEIEGLFFNGAHNAEDAVMLYERAETKLTSAKVEVLNLDCPSLSQTICEIAEAHNLMLQ